MINNQLEILLIEDNPEDAELTIRALKKYNLANHLVHLKNGIEALNFIFGREEYSQRESDSRPKVIMLDLKMPKVSGLEVLRQIKNDEQTRKIPVVVLTSSQEDPDIRECYRLGVNSYVVKPVEFEEFIKVVSDLGFYWLLVNQPPG